MISEQAKDSVHRIIERAAASRLRLDSSDHFEIEVLDTEVQKFGRKETIVVLTISSILFKVMLMLHVEDNAASRDYFLRDATDKPLEEVFLETANLFSGAVNQELLRYFPDLGMSTPYVLSAHCLDHMHALRPQYQARYRIRINETVKLSAGVCMSANAPIDFVADAEAVEESNGELEMF